MSEKGRKWGAGHPSAMWRLGLKELRNAMNPSKESVADTEIGLFGTETQGEIAKARGGPGAGPEQEGSEKKYTLAELRGIAKQKAQEAERGMERTDKQQGRDGPEKER
jgi:hypothetical protein